MAVLCTPQGLGAGGLLDSEVEDKDMIKLLNLWLERFRPHLLLFAESFPTAYTPQAHFSGRVETGI